MINVIILFILQADSGENKKEIRHLAFGLFYTC
jgi:hypothetical protein